MRPATERHFLLPCSRNHSFPNFEHVWSWPLHQDLALGRYRGRGCCQRYLKHYRRGALNPYVVSLSSFFCIALTPFLALPRIPGVVPCRTSAPARWIWVMWFLPCFFELLVLVLAVRIALQYRRTISVIDNMHLQTSRRGNLLIYVLLRDSIIFPTM